MPHPAVIQNAQVVPPVKMSSDQRKILRIDERGYDATSRRFVPWRVVVLVPRVLSLGALRPYFPPQSRWASCISKGTPVVHELGPRILRLVDAETAARAIPQSGSPSHGDWSKDQSKERQMAVIEVR